MPLYPVDKPLGLTSHDVVARARRILNTRKIGHSGTLDPLATGVLILCVNDSTKLVQFMTADSKDYLACVSFGASTATLDAEGPVLERAEVDPARLSGPALEAALEGLRGEQMQVPPQYSAIQVGGKRAYAVARAGGELELPARPVTLSVLEQIHPVSPLSVLHALEYAPGPDGWAVVPGGRRFDFPATLGDFPSVLLRVRVSSGTYLRSLARDLGLALGLPAHLSGLVRTRVGRFGLEQASALEGLEHATPHSDFEALDLPRLEVDAGTARALRDGKRVDTAQVSGAPDPLEGRFLLVQGGALVAVVDALEGRFTVVRAWARQP